MMMKEILLAVAIAVTVTAASAGGRTANGTEAVSYRDGLLALQPRTSCSPAKSCGTTMSTFNGVAAYSNGPDQCTGNSCNGYGTYGYRYQCVELAQRYFAIKYGITPIWYDNAIDMCSNYPSGVRITNSPKPGDLIVLPNPPYGHVAVITSVGSSTVNVIEQNADVSGLASFLPLFSSQ